jgi:hypothetical protein
MASTSAMARRTSGTCSSRWCRRKRAAGSAGPGVLLNAAAVDLDRLTAAPAEGVAAWIELDLKAEGLKPLGSWPLAIRG